MHLIGYDCGTSSIKASLLDAESGKVTASATSPETEMKITSPNPGWAEQNPESWWENVKTATSKVLSESGVNSFDVKAIGISYQMHGLVCVDKNLEVLRPSIIWCDSRAVDIGNKAFADLGKDKCLGSLLNSPGNFTASKLKWVKDNQPDIYSKIDKIMLPGDYVAMKMTGQITTTPSGLSEMILWDFKKNGVSDMLMEYFDFDHGILPENIVDNIALQGGLTSDAAKQLGLEKGTKVCYRAGDQPNNALSLNVLQPGEIAATAGTSGVIYGVTDKGDYDPLSRVNSFVHVNHSEDNPRYGVLLCVNGTGILNSWLKQNVTDNLDYGQMNRLAEKVPAGSEGVMVFPFGNGAERTLENRDTAASIEGINFNVHGTEHLLRASQEGIVFALNYGLDIMKNSGVEVEKVRAGDANMFLSPVFRQVFANTTGAVVELYNTDGSQGAARGAGTGAGIYKNISDAFDGLLCRDVIEPDEKLSKKYKAIYEKWVDVLKEKIGA